MANPPDSGGGKARDSGRASQTVGFLLLALVGFALLGWALGAICRSVFTASDLRIVQDVAASRTAWQTTGAHVLSFLGSGYVIYPLTLIFAAALYTRGRTASAVALAVSTFGATLIGNVDKVLVGRPRPPVHHLETVTGLSFPSGHASHTAAFCTAIVLVVVAAAPARRVKISASIAAALFTLSVATSRVVLSVHYPSDVVAGMFLGVTWSLATRWLISLPAARSRRIPIALRRRTGAGESRPSPVSSPAASPTQRSVPGRRQRH
jgi:undecaprenyl-diphosphatase